MLQAPDTILRSYRCDGATGPETGICPGRILAFFLFEHTGMTDSSHDVLVWAQVAPLGGLANDPKDVLPGGGADIIQKLGLDDYTRYSRGEDNGLSKHRSQLNVFFFF